MSLQKLPPTSPPERISEQPSSAIESPSDAEQSYSRRLVRYAWEETRGHQKVELIATTILATIAAFIGGASAGGVASGVIAAVLTLLGMMVVIFIIHLVRAPKALDRRLREQLSLHEKETTALEAQLKAECEKEVVSLRAKLDEFTPKLIFEVERCPQCRATLKHEKYLFDPPDGEPKEVDYYVINANVKIHIANDDVIELRLQRRMTVSLFRRTGRGKEKEIPLDPERESLLMVAGEGSQVMPKLEDYIFAPLKKTGTLMLFCGMGISTRYGKRLNRDCFIRLTMEAIRQLPCYVDLDVDWEAAKTEKGSAMTPRTSARCQAHR